MITFTPKKLFLCVWLKVWNSIAALLYIINCLLTDKLITGRVVASLGVHPCIVELQGTAFNISLSLLPPSLFSFLISLIWISLIRHHQHGRWQARIGRVAGNKDLYLGTFSKLFCSPCTPFYYYLLLMVNLLYFFGNFWNKNFVFSNIFFTK